MNKEQLAKHIGDIDDLLVEEAGRIPDYRRQHRKKIIRRLVGAAAAVVLMTCSFSAGALAFSGKTVVEVPVEKEMISFEEIDLTMILPDNWRGKYSVEKKGQNYIVYNKQIREATSKGADAFDGGILFHIVCYKEAMTPEQFVEKGYDFVEYRYLYSTSNSTYVLCYASDVQWNPEDAGQEAAYQQMASEIEDIKFVVDNAFAD